MRFWRRKPLSASPVQAGQQLFIKDLVSRVHDELLQSRREREQRGDRAIFEVEQMTLEVHFVAQHTTGFDGGLDLKIVTVGGASARGARTYSSQQIHKITLTLTAVPYRADGTDPLLDLDRTPAFLPSED
jgi:hypothetical protein